MSDVKGRVLFVGSSYYNTRVLSKALRDRGWQADTLQASFEGADRFGHGSDFYVEPLVGRRLRGAGWRRLFGGLASAAGRRYRARIEVGKRPKAGAGRGQTRVLTALRRALRIPGTRTAFGSAVLPGLIETLVNEEDPIVLEDHFRFLLQWLGRDAPPGSAPIQRVLDYDIIHFSGMNNMRLLYMLAPYLDDSGVIGWDVDVVRRLGRRIVYSHNGCKDGVAQSSFRRWGSEPVCDICSWRDVPSVCSDRLNLAWGALRNDLADYQVLLGGNRVDYNVADSVHEVPEFYCLDPEFWRLDLAIPREHRLDSKPGTVRIFHAVGNYSSRTRSEKNIKTTHVVVPTVERLQANGLPVELVFCSDVHSRDVRYYQSQSDIVVDMLTFGFFGANVREAMMLGKPVVCYLRPEWLESMRREIPEYVEELPIVSATPETVYEVLEALVGDANRRDEIGRRSRAFAMKWHSSEAAGRRFDDIYSELLGLSPTAL